MSAKRKGRRRGKAPSKRAMRRRQWNALVRWPLLSQVRSLCVQHAVNQAFEQNFQRFREMFGLPPDTHAPGLSFVSESVLNHARRGIVYGSIT